MHSPCSLVLGVHSGIVKTKPPLQRGSCTNVISLLTCDGFGAEDNKGGMQCGGGVGHSSVERA